MGIVLYNVRPTRMGRRQEWDAMKTKVRDDSTVWLVCRRESGGPHKKGRYHIMGVGCPDEKGKNAEQVAVRMCKDETYFIFPLPVNFLLPEKPIAPPKMYFPLKSPGKDLRKDYVGPKKRVGKERASKK